MLDILFDSLRNAVLVSGLVVIMMMLIESLNIDSGGDFFSGLRRSRVGQVVVSAFLGVIPGCMGGFASVSLYTHGIISFGALVAMMIASSGDEAFVLLSVAPGKAIWIFLILFALAVAVGVLTDFLYRGGAPHKLCCQEFELHDEDDKTVHSHLRSFSWPRAMMFLGVVLFLVALLSGMLEHGHEPVHTENSRFVVNLLSEEWMYWLFGTLSLIVLFVLIFGSNHFVQEHLWHHIVCHHLPSVFFWTFGVLLFLGIALNFFDISSWINSNTALMILLAALIGIIPESGPHLIFVTLYASGIVPLPVLLASCISQDGHSSLPLLAESKTSFLCAKLINCAVALLAGFGCMMFL